MNIIQDYHQRKRGWSDIGYKLVLLFLHTSMCENKIYIFMISLKIQK